MSGSNKVDPADPASDPYADRGSLTYKQTRYAYMASRHPPPAFASEVELANSRLGGKVLGTSNEWFAAAENVIEFNKPVWREPGTPGAYVPTGKWMDGWESARHNAYKGNQYDWVVIRLGLPGILEGFNVDTAYFDGNACPAASVLAIDLGGAHLSADKVLAIPQDRWTEVLSKSECDQTSPNYFAATTKIRATHVLLRMWPDGGVARFRVYGKVKPDFKALAASGQDVDLVAVGNGGLSLAVSDMHFGHKDNVLSPWNPIDMQDGWETARSRSTDHSDWLVAKCGHQGKVHRVEISTRWFRGNFPQEFTLEGALVGTGDWKAAKWTAMIDKSKLVAHQEQYFAAPELVDIGPIDHVRITIFPDGGIARLRLWGKLVDA